ncbi:MAG: hypothetical protein ACTSPF_07210, partial [Candidatus Heimdallarchaeaceae archaeon]
TLDKLLGFIRKAKEMKSKKILPLMVILLLGMVALGSSTTQAKVTKIDFTALEYMFPPAGVFVPPTVWISDDGVVHWDDAMFPFVVFGDIDGVLHAGIKRMNIDPVTKIGHAIGTNSFEGTLMKNDQFYGLDLEFSGVSVMVRIDGKISGEATSHGTLGEYSIFMKATFTPATGGMTLIEGTFTIHL